MRALALPPAAVARVAGGCLALALFFGMAKMTAAQACEPGEPAMASAAFPLSVSADHRHLQDAQGKPFFITGDAAWSLIAQLSREDADKYLRARRAQGFNTVLVNLIEHKFASKAPANIYGDAPFAGDDFTQPNEAYFKHADWVLQRACELGFLVVMTPSYAGYQGGEEGWYQEMINNGTDKLSAYGRFLGTRYKGFDNIIWLQAGDFNPPDKNLIRAVAAGIRETDPAALHTVHTGPGTAALTQWPDEAWLSLNNVYTYDDVRLLASAQYKRRPAMPFFLLESAYEYENGADAARVRRQAYAAFLSGATGEIYGNNPIWHFDAPGPFPAPSTWQEALDSPGIRGMIAFHNLVGSVEWWTLKPNLDGGFIVRDAGYGPASALAAVTADGRLALAYLPAGHRVELDLARLAGEAVSARWYDPSNGTYTAVEGMPFPAKSRTFAPPARNSAGGRDWVLELTSQSDGEKTP